MKKILILILTFLVLCVSAASVQAQDYYFRVEREDVKIFIESDGTATIEYIWTFTNGSGSPYIEYVDVALPTTRFSTSRITANAKGQSVSITNWEDIGVSLYLGRSSIAPGETATVTFRIEGVEGLIYTSEQKLDEPYASFQFSPNYFGSQYVFGSTEMSVTLILPPGLTESDQPTFYPASGGWPGNAEPNIYLGQDGRLRYAWNARDASASREYIFGSSFPARLVPAEVIQTPPLFNIKIDPDVLIPVCFFGGFFGLFIGGAVWGVVADKRRRMQYLPPKIAIEGNGIKRGLTAVEAAILMEQPMDKILTMILFGSLKKEAAQVISKDPLQLEVAARLPDNLHVYEQEFLNAFKEPNLPTRRRALQEMMVNLVKSLTEKMRGFSRKETVAYYESIMKKAWEQVEAAATPEVQMEKFGEAMEWTMLDRRFNDRTREIFSAPRPVIMPYWWGRFDPVYRAPTGTGAPSVSRPISVSVPSLPGSDFAASIVNGISGFSAQAVGDVTGFTSGVTNKTNPVPVSTSSGSRGGGSSGGRSCACACACACAGCACACAGGGR